MGYYSHAYGNFYIEPPLNHAETQVWRNKFDNAQRVWWANVQTRTTSSDKGTLTAEHIDILSPPDDSFKAYESVEALENIVAAFPGHEFEGAVEFYGEDNTDIWRLRVVDGKVIEDHATIRWDDGTEVSARY